eukprot:ANDGO_04535.mRNA.1 hypothetical protein
MKVVSGSLLPFDPERETGPKLGITGASSAPLLSFASALRMSYTTSASFFQSSVSTLRTTSDEVANAVSSSVSHTRESLESFQTRFPFVAPITVCAAGATAGGIVGTISRIGRFAQTRCALAGALAACVLVYPAQSVFLAYEAGKVGKVAAQKVDSVFQGDLAALWTASNQQK